MHDDTQGAGEHNHCDSCGHCGSCCHGHGQWGHRGPLHWLIKIIVLIIVFWMGVQYGELSGFARFGGGMMGGYYDGGPGPVMMYYGSTGASAAQGGGNVYYRMMGATTSAPVMR
jgi:hypothetical protein